MLIDPRITRGDWFQTWSGVKFYPFDPRPEEINLTDIAEHLAKTCRFGGAVRDFYSVAQHSVIVSVEAEHLILLAGADAELARAVARCGLLHDAAEAYIGDMVRPLKLGMPEYRAVEHRIEAAITTRFGLLDPMPAVIKRADNAALMTERRDLLLHQMVWTERAAALSEVIVPLDWRSAMAAFWARAVALGLVAA